MRYRVVELRCSQVQSNLILTQFASVRFFHAVISKVNLAIKLI